MVLLPQAVGLSVAAALCAAGGVACAANVLPSQLCAKTPELQAWAEHFAVAVTPRYRLRMWLEWLGVLPLATRAGGDRKKHQGMGFSHWPVSPARDGGELWC